MGASTVLIEKHKMGGDCLNTGCVPSKALLAAGHAAESIRGAARFGVDAALQGIDAARVFGHVHGTIAAIAPMDSVERFVGLGVKVIEAAGRFTGPREVEAAGRRIRARRFVVATGSRAFTNSIRKIVGTRASAQFNYFNSFATDKPGSVDVLICDEAHRIRSTSVSRFTRKDQRSGKDQVEELLDVAKVAVFFIDDLQVVRPGEIGSADLIVEAKVKSKDIDSVKVGATVKVRILSFNPRLTPPIDGYVVSVAADVSSDSRPGQDVFPVLIRLDPKSVQHSLNGQQMSSGMPASTIIAVGERTLLTYWMTPLISSFELALREP